MMKAAINFSIGPPFHRGQPQIMKNRVQHPYLNRNSAISSFNVQPLLDPRPIPCHARRKARQNAVTTPET